MNFVFMNGLLIDGLGGEPIPQGFVATQESRIKAVGWAGDYSDDIFEGEDAVEIDLTGKTIMPGLINCHEHLDERWGIGPYKVRAAQPVEWSLLRGTRNALLALQEGATTVRDMGFKKGKSLIMRQAVDAGMIVGPRILSCGEAISMTGGHGWELNLEADGPDEVRKAVRQQLRAGADFIKLFASGGYISQTKDLPWSMQYNEDEMRAGFLEAKKAGKKTTVHCHPPAAIQASIRAGVDCIEHGALIDRESAEMMAQKGIYLVPTVGEGWMMAHRGLELERPAWQVEMGREHLLDSQTMTLAVEAGIKMAVGTDVIASMALEMKLMVEGGLTPMDVLVAATRNGAELCDLLDETGTLQAGKSADVIVIDGNPLVKMEAMERVVQVLVRGKSYCTAELASATGMHPL